MALRSTKLAVVPLIALFAGAATTPNAPPSRFGAISYSTTTRLHGAAQDFLSERDAVIRSLNACEAQAKSGDCRVLVTFRDGCGALAESPDGAFGSGWGVDAAKARFYARGVCTDGGGWACRVTQVICSGISTR